MPRYKLTIEYDGSPYVGWQKQTNGLSVQRVLEEAIRAMCGKDTLVYGAGRTDAGVHALGQVAHIDLVADWRTDVIRDAINSHIRPNPVTILSCDLVADDFDARFSAIRRHYVYVILNRRAPPAVERGRVWHVARSLDAAAMHEAAQYLVGKHDFTTFRASECQAKSPVRTLEKLAVVQLEDRLEIHATALSFLHNQVRSMAGSLEHVGSGKWEKDKLAQILRARDRKSCGVVAPPHGLYLNKVEY